MPKKRSSEMKKVAATPTIETIAKHVDYSSNEMPGLWESCFLNSTGERVPRIETASLNG